MAYQRPNKQQHTHIMHHHTSQQQEQQQRLHHPHHPPQHWSFNPATPHTEVQQPLQGIHGQEHWTTRKRATFMDEDDVIVKKRTRGSEDSAQGSFGWSGLLESVSGSSRPGSALSLNPSGASSTSSPILAQGYFERRSTPQYDPATPPLDSGPFQTSGSSSHFLRSGSARPQNFDLRNVQTLGQGFSLPGTTAMRGPGIAGLHHLGIMETEMTSTQLGLQHPNQQQQQHPHYQHQHIITHGGVSIRSLSPAPSSPSESLKDGDDNHEDDNSSYHWGSPKHGRISQAMLASGSGSSSSLRLDTNVGGLEGEEAFSVDKGALRTRSGSRVGIAALSTGQVNFVMGFRPGCERCRRREKGHFAHFE